MKFSWKTLLLTLVIGVCIAALTGFAENTPSNVTIPENKYYGFPMIWRIHDAFAGEKIMYYAFFLDFLFWTAITAITASIVKVLGRLL